MESMYAEAGVARKTSGLGYFIKGFCIVILVVLLVLMAALLTVTGQFMAVMFYAPFIVAMVGIMYVVFPKLSVEYEYIFCDDRIDFARILGKASRKNMIRLEMEVIELIAPLTSTKLDSYSKLPIKDFSSRGEKDGKYVIVAPIKDKPTKIIFEPSQKMIECMYFRAPRKVEK